MRTTPKISVLWIFLNKSHLNTGGEECREQIHTHKTKFLKPFLDLVQSGGAINPKMENFRVMPVNSLAFDRQNQIHVSVSKHSFVLIVTPWKALMVICTLFSTCKFSYFSCKTIAWSTFTNDLCLVENLYRSWNLNFSLDVYYSRGCNL